MAEQLDPRQRKRERLVTVDLGNGFSVQAKRCDLPMMLFEGVVPTPLMAAAEKFIKNREEFPSDRMDDLTEDERPQMLEVLRAHAVNVVVNPTVVPMDDGVEDHMPVTLFDLQELLAIWSQTAVLPKVGAAEAATFRVRQRSTLESIPRPRQDIRPEPEPVVAALIERRGA
jgi:hypothetical protein